MIKLKKGKYVNDRFITKFFAYVNDFDRNADDVIGDVSEVISDFGLNYGDVITISCYEENSEV